MNIFSIYPEESSEKAISNYTKQLIKGQKSQGVYVSSLTYTAGDYSTLKLDDIKERDVVHIQHEYNLFGKFGLPFFHLYQTLGKKKVRVITTMHNVLSKKQKFEGNPIKTILRKQLYKYQNEILEKNSDIIIVRRILQEDFGE